jgi:hypothetical protein
LREVQRTVEEKTAMLKANEEKMAEDQKIIAALQAQLAEQASQI